MAPKGKTAKCPRKDTLINNQPNLDRAEDCPEALKDIFVLINRTRLLHDDLKPQLKGQTFNAGQNYEKQLMWRAREMSDACSIRGMNDQPEFEWQSVMAPHAFLSLNDNEEEKTHGERQYHQCLACYRVFRPGSRPLLHAQSNANVALGPVDDSQICEEHSNLPSFVYASQLRFYYQNEERQKQSSKVPDATIGLCAYNLRNEPWQQQKPHLRADPRIKLFSQSSLETIFKTHEYLKGPYPDRVLNDGVPQFAFALWEAKKSGGDSHWSAFTQLDKRVRLLLQWQDTMIKAAKNHSNEFRPVVWAFTSVGSVWTVYGCYQSLFFEDEKPFASGVELWSGNVCDKNRALQFLWIVDIIKFWAEYTYKPMMGACLARLKAEVDKHEQVPLDETLWKSHIALNSSSGDSRPKLKPKSLSDQCSPLTPETAPAQILHRTLTLDEQQTDDFTWIQDRDVGHGDLLVIRVGREGKIDNPLVLLDCTINQNTAQYSDMVISHADVDVGLLRNGIGVIYLLQEHYSFFSSDLQFYAILPLEPQVYQGQRQQSNKSSIFAPLEELLDIEGLYRIYYLECILHEDYKKPLMIKASDGEYNTKSYEGGCDKITSNDKVSTGNGHDGSRDDVGRKKENEERQNEEEDEKDNDDDKLTNDEGEYHIQAKWTEHIEDFQEAWKRHNWPDGKSQIRTFARIALRLQQARKKAYNLKDDEIYPYQAGDIPIDWITPVKDFGESVFRVERTDKQSSFNKTPADSQSYKDSDSEQTLRGSGHDRTKGFKDLRSKYFRF